MNLDAFVRMIPIGLADEDIARALLENYDELPDEVQAAIQRSYGESTAGLKVFEPFFSKRIEARQSLPELEAQAAQSVSGENETEITLSVGEFSARVQVLSMGVAQAAVTTVEDIRAAIERFAPERDALGSPPLGAAAEILSEYRFILIALSDWQIAVGQYGRALSGLVRAEEVARRTLLEHGESQAGLRQLGLALERRGDFDLQVMGDTASARARCEEGLANARRIVAEFGETPESLRDLSVSLNKLGDFDLRVTGDTTAARARYEESLAIRRRIGAKFGETPQSLRDLSVSLDRLGDFDLRVTGDTASARDRYEESLAICRRIVAEFGETPRSLRDVSVSLNKLGKAAAADQRGEQARVYAQQDLDIARRILDQFGESPQSLEDVAISLISLADGDPDPAASWQEAYRLMRRRNRRFDPSIQSRQWEDQLKADLTQRNIPLPPDEAETS